MPTHRVTLDSRLAFAVVAIAYGSMVAGCNRNPAGPDPIGLPVSSSRTPPAGVPIVDVSVGAARSVTSSHSVTQFDLLAGVFKLTVAGSDQIAGTYTGQASISTSGQQTSALNFEIRGGTGAFQGATGHLKGK